MTWRNLNVSHPRYKDTSQMPSVRHVSIVERAVADTLSGEMTQEVVSIASERSRSGLKTLTCESRRARS